MPHDHYFTERPSCPHRLREFNVEMRGRRMTFQTDAGVFSGGGLDRGTRLLVESLELPPSARRLVDLGCGYGAIGLIMATLAPDALVYMIDPNERACGLAKENASRNGLNNVAVLCGGGLAPITGAIDFVATNPPIRAGKSVIYGLMAESAARLVPGGELWAVARTSQGAKSYARELHEYFTDVQEVEKGGGYRVFRARK